MDHKKFMSELQRRSGIDKSRLNFLLKGTRKIICEQAIHLNTITIDNLGSFEPHKRLEFIYEDTKQKQQILYPPRIVIHFTPAPSVKKSFEKGVRHE